VAKYLVTGGCGFIGSHLVDDLCGRGHSVRIIDDLSTGTAGYMPQEAALINGDIAEAGLVAEAIIGVDGCFHLAAVASVERGHADRLGTHRTNLTGTITVLDAAWKANPKRPIPVIFASSAAVYGDNTNTPHSEDALLRPVSAYGADKFGCELNGFVASHLHQVPTRGLRFFNVYGPRQDPASPYAGVIATFCERLKAGRVITVHGDGCQTRDFIYVGDVVRALRAAMDNCAAGADVINVCTGKATTIRGLTKVVGDILGITPELTFAPPRRGDIRLSVGDPAKAQRVLGFAATTDLAAGLRQTLSCRGRSGVPSPAESSTVCSSA